MSDSNQAAYFQALLEKLNLSLLEKLNSSSEENLRSSPFYQTSAELAAQDSKHRTYYEQHRDRINARIKRERSQRR